MEESMNYELTVIAKFQFNKDVSPIFSDTLAISLDCFTCPRTNRTVIIKADGSEPYCTPTRHAFPAIFQNKSVETIDEWTVVTYQIQYEFHPFIDPKYKSPAEPHPTWASVSFQITCPICAHDNSSGTQNNTVRPWQCKCRNCKYPFYTETEEMPIIDCRELNAEN
jgi:hypothetical protein